jgi:hypothetical protein
VRVGGHRAPAGTGRWVTPGTPDRTLALVLVNPQSGRAPFAGLVFASDREAKSARTRVEAGQPKSRAFRVCARCGSLH